MKVVLFAAALVASVMLAPAANAQTPSAQLTQLFNDERAAVWREDPLTATSDNVHDYDDRLASVTPESQARRTAADQQFLTRLRAIDRNALTHQEQISYDLFDFMVDQRVKLAR